MSRIWSVTLVVLTFAIPAAVYFWLAKDPGPADLAAAIDPSAEHYPDGVERLEAASQTLITITMATLGGTGLLLFKSESKLKWLPALSVFVLSVLSIRAGIQLSYAGAITLASGKGDILRLADMLDNQALYALGAGALLALMLVEGPTGAKE